MKLVLADLNFDELVMKSKELDVSPDRVQYVKCDVSKSDDIQKLADIAFKSFGGVHLLFNNAGVAHAQLSWEHTEDGMYVYGVQDDVLYCTVVYATQYFSSMLQVLMYVCVATLLQPSTVAETAGSSRIAAASVSSAESAMI